MRPRRQKRVVDDLPAIYRFSGAKCVPFDVTFSWISTTGKARSYTRKVMAPDWSGAVHVALYGVFDDKAVPASVESCTVSVEKAALVPGEADQKPIKRPRVFAD